MIAESDKRHDSFCTLKNFAKRGFVSVKITGQTARFYLGKNALANVDIFEDCMRGMDGSGKREPVWGRLRHLCFSCKLNHSELIKIKEMNKTISHVVRPAKR